MKLNLDFSGVTKLKDWWNTVKNNFSTIEDECSAKFENLDTLTEKVGDNTLLETEEKETLVGAVNEVLDKADDANDKFDEFADSESYTKVSQIMTFVNDEVDGIRTDMGSLANLKFEQMTSLVQAINTEIEARIANDDTSDVKLRAETAAREKAINDVLAEIDTIDDSIKEKADVIINTVSGISDIEITDSDGVYISISGGTTLTGEANTASPAAFECVTGIEVNGADLGINNLRLFEADILDCTTHKIKRKMTTYAFTGEEKRTDGTTSAWVVNGNSVFSLALNTNIMPGAEYTTEAVKKIHCTHFGIGTWSNITKGTTPGMAFLSGINNGKAYMQVAVCAPDCTDVTAFKAFLKKQSDNGTPVTVLYELAEYVPEDIDMSDVNLIKGTNTISVCGESNIKCILPSAIPEPYFAEGDEYYGETLTVDVTTNGFLVDNMSVSSEESWTLKLDTTETNYIVATFDTNDNSFGGFRVSTDFVESAITDGVWQFTVYEYSGFNFDFKVSSDSPTGDLYIYQSCDNAYSMGNADDTGSTCTIEEVFRSESSYDFRVEYSADTKLYIDNKFNELQNAILATGGNV